MSIFSEKFAKQMLSKAGKTCKRRLRILSVGEDIIKNK